MRQTLLLFLFLLTLSAFAQTTELSLNGKWQFRKVGDKEWLQATVPGTVHTDLLNNRRILDPFYGTNEQILQWIEDVDWEYKKTFDCNAQLLKKKNVDLIFDGLDTYAKIWLNDTLILSADNMFRTWKIDCKKYLQEKNNELRIVFESASRKGREASKTLRYTLPGEEKVFTRKAQYQYGWDWGPRFVTCGVWRSARISAWDAAKITDVQFYQDKLTDSIAELHFYYSAIITQEASYSVSVSSNALEKESATIYLPKGTGLKSGTISFKIKNPKRWWPNGFGKAELYSFHFSLSKAGHEIDSKNITAGLRTVELVQEKDFKGKSFFFKVNGIPVFMKGANWIPADNFLPRVTKEKYHSLLLEAKNLNMNMLRVWGGGAYEDDYFYSLCDSLGILIWQDFMFACGMYPADSSFRENVIHEVTDNATRLQNHPCIALWCGNNEIDEGWNNWGWQSQYQYSNEDSAKIWSDYKRLFEDIIPSCLKLYDNRNYIPTSPMHGWGRDESLQEGDSHYWGIWWGQELFEIYERKVGRFMSEYGFQGMPSMNSIREFCSDTNLSVTSSEITIHQKHPTGFKTIDLYMDTYYRKPKDFESYVYVSQVMQAEGIKKAIDAHRRAKPDCMGTLYWQYDDCWPVISWSSMDYYQQPKALEYFVRKGYSKYHLSAVRESGGTIIAKATSDDLDTLHAMIKIQLIDFSGNILIADSGQCTITNMKSSTVFSAPVKQVLQNNSSTIVFLKMELKKEGSVIADNVLYFEWPKLLALQKQKIDYTVTSVRKDTFSLRLSAPLLAKNVFIDFGNLNTKLDDNFFDLLPKESKTIQLTSKSSLDELKEKIRITSLVDSYE